MVTERILGADAPHYVFEISGLYAYPMSGPTRVRVFLSADCAFTSESFDHSLRTGSACPCAVRAAETCAHRGIVAGTAPLAPAGLVAASEPRIALTRAIHGVTAGQAVFSILAAERADSGVFVALNFSSSDGDEIMHRALVKTLYRIACQMCGGATCLHAQFAMDFARYQCGVVSGRSAWFVRPEDLIAPNADAAATGILRVGDTRVGLRVDQVGADFRLEYLIDPRPGPYAGPWTPGPYAGVRLERRGGRVECRVHGAVACADAHLLDAVLEKHGRPRA